MRSVVFLALLALLCGCAFTPRPGIQTDYTYNEEADDGQWVPQTICAGMNSSDVVAKLGAPVWSAHGHSCRLYHQFDGVWPGMHTTELGFQRGDDLVVVWVEAGTVLAVGVKARHYVRR